MKSLEEKINDIGYDEQDWLDDPRTKQKYMSTCSMINDHKINEIKNRYTDTYNLNDESDYYRGVYQDARDEIKHLKSKIDDLEREIAIVTGGSDKAVIANDLVTSERDIENLKTELTNNKYMLRNARDTIEKTKELARVSQVALRKRVVVHTELEKDFAEAKKREEALREQKKEVEQALSNMEEGALISSERVDFLESQVITLNGQIDKLVGINTILRRDISQEARRLASLPTDDEASDRSRKLEL